MNIPNLLSMLRLVLVPVFCGVFFSGMPHAHRIAGIIFLVASLTDMLDGYLARRLNQITKLGRVLDPLADKLMTAAALISLLIAKMVPLWIVVIFGIKELMMMLGGLVLYGKISDVPASNVLGKIATTLFFVSIVLIMLFELPSSLTTPMLSIATGFTLAAFVTYLYRFLRLVGQSRRTDQ